MDNKEIVEKVKVGDIIEATYGVFKVVKIEKLYDPFTLKEHKGILVDFNGYERMVRNEDITRIVESK